MSTLLVPWVAFPLLFVALSWGCGLLLERVSGLKLPGALVVPCGFAVVALVAQFAVLTDATAELATPAVLVAAVAGFVIVRPWRGLHVDSWASFGSGGVRRIRGADRPLGSGDVRRLHQARRRLDAHRARRSSHGARAQRGRPGVLHVLPRRRSAARRGLPARFAAAARASATTSSAATRSGSISLRWPSWPPCSRSASTRWPDASSETRWLRALRGRRRCAVGAALRVRALGRHQGDRYRVGAARPGRAVPLGRQAERLRQLIPLAAVSALLLGVLNPARSCGSLLRSVLPRPRRARARPPRGRAAAAAFLGSSRPSRCRRSSPPALPHVEHRQLRPDREPRSRRSTRFSRRHLAVGRTSVSIRSSALRRTC